MNIFKKLFGSKPTPQNSQPIVSINDIFVDVTWGDTKLQICQLHKSQPLVRYKFLMVDGKPILNSGLHDMDMSFLLSHYTHESKWEIKT